MMRGHWRRIAGHSSVAISARYVHPSEDAVFAALDRPSGHNFGHSENTYQERVMVEPLLSASHEWSWNLVGTRGSEVQVLSPRPTFFLVELC